MVVLVPAYEPDTRLLALVADLRRADPSAHVLVVDDGSGPAYRPLFDRAADLGCTVLHHPCNRGKGAALKTGLRHVLAAHPGEEVVCADSDGQHRVDDVLRVSRAVRAGHRHVLGARRFTGTVPLRSRWGNDATRVLFRLATGRGLRDTQTGLRGYAPELLPELLEVPGERFDYELQVLLRAARRGERIEEVDIATVYLEGNASSHFRPLVDSARVYRPLLLFLGSSMLAFALDTAAFLVLLALTGALVPSAVAARLLSATVNFAVNRRVVFGAGRPLRAAATRYAALASGLLVADVCLLAALHAAGAGAGVAKALTEGLLVGLSYGVQRACVFTRRHLDPQVAVPLPRTEPVTAGLVTSRAS